MHVCFVAPYLYPVLAAQRQIPVVGGAEVQQSLIARGLAHRGWRVTALSRDFGQQDGCVVDGVKVLRIPRSAGGVPLLKWLHPRLTAVWAAMKRADADIYYQRCAGAYTGLVAAFCRRHGRKFVFSCASDSDLVPAECVAASRRDRVLYQYGLRRADALVLQSEAQMRQCAPAYGKARAMIPSCYETEHGHGRGGTAVLWVGVMRRHKRPELFLELARRLPGLDFCMVGGPCASGTEQRYFDQVRAAAAAMPNVRFMGFVPYAEVGACFDRAAMLVNTSVVEGFPNTFLQAWARGVPTVSFFDAGARDDRGAVSPPVSDLAALTERVSRYMRDHGSRLAAGERCLAYFRRHHTPEAVLDAYEALFEGLMAADATARPSLCR